MKKIKKAIDEFLEEIEGCCEQLDILFECEMKREKEYHIKLNKDNLIRVYDTKNGLNPDLSQIKNSELGEKVLNFWEKNYFKEIINDTYSYKGIKNITNDLSIVKEFAERNNCIFSEKDVKNKNVIYCVKLEDKYSHENITIQLFTNKTLTLQGDRGVLWEKLCQDIEKAENIVEVKYILNRVVGDNHSIDTGCYEEELKNILTEDVYSFLSREDQEYLLCSQQLIMEEKKFTVYTPVLCCAALALEGYFKTILLRLGIIKSIEISKSNFNFGVVFNGNKFDNSKIKYINVDDSRKEKVVGALELIYRKVKTYRNPVCHSGAGVAPTLKVKSFNKCKELYFNEYIDIIKSTYDIIYG